MMTGESLEVRIAQRITADGSVIIPPRIARWLEAKAGMTADRRMRLRSTDPEAYIAFAALHLSACRSDCGTEQVAAQPNTTELAMGLTTTEAAKALNVTDRCIRKWCQSGQLSAHLVGARWLINPTAIAHKTRTA